MINIVQLLINISIEATLIPILVALLFTFLWQKKLFPTTIPLISLLSCIILMLINQIVGWVIFAQKIPIKYGVMPMRFIYVIDYILYYSVSLSFYYYIEAIIKEGYRNTGINYIPNKTAITIMKIWGVFTSIMYFILLFVPSFYRIENGTIYYNLKAYPVLYFSARVIVFYIIYVIIKNIKVIGRHEAYLSISYILIVSFLVIFDDLCGICVSYVLTSLYTFILYVRIDLHKGLILERQEKEIVEYKTQIMLSQIKPHFIYNILTTISSMCELQNAIQAKDVVNKFADYLRINLDTLGQEKIIPFERELEHVKTYLWLEKVRFEDEFDICYDIGPTEFAIPSLTVQPIVENAIKHGILPKDEHGIVTIKTSETSNEYIISIEDDGVGFNIKKHLTENNNHVGIENVTKRLEIICNGSCNIQSEEGKGTIVTIHIPKGE